MYNEIIDVELSKIDKFSKKFCLIFLGVVGTAWFLNELNIYILDKPSMRILFLVTALCMMLPTVLYTKMENVIHWRYVVSTVINIQMGLLYTFLSAHAVLPFALPVTLIAIYGDKKLSKYTIFGTYFSMAISHALSVKYSIVFDDIYVGHMYETLIFALSPRVLVYTGFVALLNYTARRNAYMFRKAINYARDMHTTQKELITQFATISESKSGQTGHHIARVAKYMEVFADELGIKEDKDNLVLASMMHDIGKLLIPSAIIEKPSKLTDEEYEIVKKHTEYGYNLLEKSPGRVMEIASIIALQHHERYDGKGYAGIKGEDIDYYSRIMAIIDVYDALVSRRSYKPPFPPDEVYLEIINGSGTQFDPELIEVFKKCYPTLKEIAESMPDEE